MGLTNPGRALRQSSLLLIFRKVSTQSGISLFSINSFRLASLLALLVELNLFSLTGALAWFIKITRFAPFKSVEVFCKNPLLALYLSLFINDLPASVPLQSAALFTLTIWPFGPSLPRSSLQCRLHKELCFDWSAGLGTGVFLSI